MKRVTFKAFGGAIGLLILAFAGCGEPDGTDDDASSSGDGNAGGTVGTGESVGADGQGGDGGQGASGPDDDDGPPWDGQLPGPPTLLAESVEGFAMLADDHVVVRRRDTTTVTAQPATGGTEVPVTEQNDGWLIRAGHAALMASNGGLLAWSASAGLVDLDIASVDSFFIPSVFDNEAEDWALVAIEDVDGTKRLYGLDTQTLALASLGPNVTAIKCTAQNEGVACIEETPRGAAVVLASRDGKQTIGALPETGLYRIDVVGDHVVVSGSEQAYSVPIAGGTAKLIASGSFLMDRHFEGDWYVVAASDAVTAMKGDGSQSWTLPGAATFAPEGQVQGDGRRFGRVPVCDGDFFGGYANLSMVDLETQESIFVSESCQPQGLTYSDRYVLFLDAYEEIDDPILSGHGTPTVMDLDTGERWVLETGSSFAPVAMPLRKSAWVVSWLAFGDYRLGGYFDAHTTVGTQVASMGAIDQFTKFVPTNLTFGAVFLTRNQDDLGVDVYFQAFPD